MASDTFERLLKPNSDCPMRCYKVTEQSQGHGHLYPGLIDWILIEETEARRFLVIGGATNRVYEGLTNPRVLSIEGIKAIEQALWAVVSTNGYSIAPEIWDNFGSDTIDTSIDRVQALFGGRLFAEMGTEAATDEAATDDQERKSLSARLKLKSTAINAGSNQQKKRRREIKKIFSELRRKAQAEQVYWRELDPTPSGRERYLLVVK